MTDSGKYAIKIAVERYLKNTFTPDQLNVLDDQVRQVSLFDNKQYTVKVDYPIKIWTTDQTVDVALLEDDKLIAIAVCIEQVKTPPRTIENMVRVGLRQVALDTSSKYDAENGVRKVKGYLWGTKAQLGIFANSTTSEYWTYLHRTQGNDFAQVSQQSFECLVRQSTTDKPQQIAATPKTNTTAPQISIEKNVKATVKQYLNNIFTTEQRRLLDPKGYTVKTDYPIKVYHIDRKADVALLADDKLLAIAVCMEQGAVEQRKTNKIKRLKTHLKGTDTQLGIFANSVNPNSWIYLQRKQGNNFRSNTDTENEFATVTIRTFENLVIQNPTGHSSQQSLSKSKTQQQITTQKQQHSEKTKPTKDSQVPSKNEPIKTEIHTQPTVPKPKQQPSKTKIQQTTPQKQNSAEPMNENDIREIVIKYLQGRIDTKDKARCEFIKEYTVRWGRDRTGRADLVLLHKHNNEPFVVVECKRPGVVGNGKAQLESYINVTPARLGIFANDPNPDNWIFYDTTTGFNEIPRETFNRQLQKELTRPRDIETEIQRQTEQRIDNEANQFVTSAAGQKAITELSDKLIEAEAKKRITENRIQGSIQSQLQQQIKNMQAENSFLKAEVASKFGCAIWGWVMFGFAVLLMGIVIGG